MGKLSGQTCRKLGNTAGSPREGVAGSPGGENGSVSNDNGEEIADAVVRGVVWGRKKSQP